MDTFSAYQSAPTFLDIIVTPALILVLVWLAITDWRSFRLPDAGTLPLIGAGLIVAAWRIHAFPIDSAIGGVAGYALFALIGAMYFKSRGIDALGLGDAKLLSAAGVWLGWQSLPTVIMIAAVTGIAGVLLRRGDHSAPIAFGPMLAMSFSLHWVWFILQ